MNPEQKFENILKTRVFKDKISDVILFGAGVNGLLLSEIFERKLFRISYFCDNDPKKWNHWFNGIRCISPKDLEKFNPGTTAICIASLYWREIEAQMKNMGFLTIVNITNFTDEYKNHFDHRLLKTHTGDVEKVRGLLCDNRSKEVFDNIVKFRYSGFDELLVRSFDPEQYFPGFFIQHFTPTESFADCGAYDGENIDQFLIKCDKKFKEIFAFEPDPENFTILQNRFKNFSKIHLLNAGVYREDTILSFETGLKTASKICNINKDGSCISRITVRSLDSALKTKPISFIKMDIEGAELDALHGSREIILKNKPKLAICVYHKPSDLWQIPLYIHSLNPEYKIFLRHHSFTLTETVCYAI